jgi:hypothetical protein
VTAQSIRFLFRKCDKDETDVHLGARKQLTRNVAARCKIVEDVAAGETTARVCLAVSACVSSKSNAYFRWRLFAESSRESTCTRRIVTFWLKREGCPSTANVNGQAIASVEVDSRCWTNMGRSRGCLCMLSAGGAMKASGIPSRPRDLDA